MWVVNGILKKVESSSGCGASLVGKARQILGKNSCAWLHMHNCNARGEKFSPTQPRAMAFQDQIENNFGLTFC